KRDQSENEGGAPNGKATKQDLTSSASHEDAPHTKAPVSIQIITGSYERVLHGIIATIPLDSFQGKNDDTEASVSFSDSFLFNAHTSAIRCLAISPQSDSQKVILATGSTDERINLYSLSTVPPPPSKDAPKNGTRKPSALTSIIKPTSTNPTNKELGTLNHHASTVTTLTFPTRTKLLSSAADNSIAILRTRDWSVLSSLRAPIPKPAGRPSGDTAAPGEVPAGVNDLAVHPSLKLMVSVGRGERCMRLWNLVTGKKAGVLQFSKSLLAQVGEGRFGSGEGRKVVWEPNDGEEYVVGFERGAVVFGMDSKPKAKLLPRPLTKVHQMQYLPSTKQNILAVSTEDGRILFYRPEPQTESDIADASAPKDDTIPDCELLAQLGGRDAGILSRIKDFDLLPMRSVNDGDDQITYIVVTACSDGAVNLWTVDIQELGSEEQPEAKSVTTPLPTVKQVGRLLGTYETTNRITCMKAFLMIGKGNATVNGDDEEEGAEDVSSSESDD
ncbi:WD40 repeat-like protein, partial [Rhizodiscina lignyota]